MVSLRHIVLTISVAVWSLLSRMELDATFQVASVEHALLREKDILKFVGVIMKESFELEALRNMYDKNKESIRRRAEARFVQGLL